MAGVAYAVFKGEERGRQNTA